MTSFGSTPIDPRSNPLTPDFGRVAIRSGYENIGFKLRWVYKKKK